MAFKQLDIENRQICRLGVPEGRLAFGFHRKIGMRSKIRLVINSFLSPFMEIFFYFYNSSP
jgi:hypothetical protein